MPDDPASVRITWMDERPQAGPGTRFDVATGLLAELHADRGFLRATCLAAQLDAGERVDQPVGARWYLVRARNACGAGTYGTSARGPMNYRARLDAPATTPCP